MEDISIIKKTETALDDLINLWRRRKLLCIIVVAIISTPLIYSVVITSQMKSKLENAEKAKENAEKAKDKAELQLAPFLAAANQGFPNIDPEKRLELLLSKLNDAVINVQDAARRISSERNISADLKCTLIENLKKIQPLEVNVVSIIGDAETYSLAVQIKDIFEEAGWKVEGVDQATYTVPPKHLVLVFGKKATPELERAITPLVDSFGYQRKAVLDDMIGENAMRIIVGSK
ncbi:MAG: hypothetical protein WC481_06070 [Candidatus Omnitrophota bacterium]